MVVLGQVEPLAGYYGQALGLGPMHLRAVRRFQQSAEELLDRVGDLVEFATVTDVDVDGGFTVAPAGVVVEQVDPLAPIGPELEHESRVRKLVLVQFFEQHLGVDGLDAAKCVDDDLRVAHPAAVLLLEDFAEQLRQLDAVLLLPGRDLVHCDARTARPCVAELRAWHVRLLPELHVHCLQLLQLRCRFPRCPAGWLRPEPFRIEHVSPLSSGHLRSAAKFTSSATEPHQVFAEFRPPSRRGRRPCQTTSTISLNRRARRAAGSWVNMPARAQSWARLTSSRAAAGGAGAAIFPRRARDSNRTARACCNDSCAVGCARAKLVWSNDGWVINRSASGMTPAMYSPI